MSGDTDWGGLSDAAIRTLEEKMQSAVSAGIAQGLRSAIEDEDLAGLVVDRALAAFQQRAQAASGRWLLDSAAGAARRIAWFMALGVVVYMTGGWAALVMWFKGGSPGGH